MEFESTGQCSFPCLNKPDETETKKERNSHRQKRGRSGGSGTGGRRLLSQQFISSRNIRHVCKVMYCRTHPNKYLRIDVSTPVIHKVPLQ